MESSIATESNFLGVTGTDTNDVLAPMSPASIFRALSHTELEELSSSVSIRRARRHQSVFREGATLSHLYLVQSGSFKLVRHSQDGQALIVALVATGGCFGSMGEPLVSATRAEALEESVYLVVPLNAVRHILKRNAEFALALVTSAEARRRKTEERAAQLAFEAVSQRVARLLLDTSDRHSGELVFPLTQTEIANLIGSRRETVCSILNRFRRDNLISIRRGHVCIRNRSSLSSVK